MDTRDVKPINAASCTLKNDSCSIIPRTWLVYSALRCEWDKPMAEYGCHFQQTDDPRAARNPIAGRLAAPLCPRLSAARTSVSVSASLPLRPRLLLHYLKLHLVFIWRAGDVASSSTFPSRVVYIREPIWRYKTRQRRGGGPQSARRGDVEAILRSGELRARQPRDIVSFRGELRMFSSA